jgi:alpha-D-ribose 1-methylphosphonate 5-triphosphate synthase subunit PhnH
MTTLAGGHGTRMIVRRSFTSPSDAGITHDMSGSNARFVPRRGATRTRPTDAARDRGGRTSGSSVVGLDDGAAQQLFRVLVDALASPGLVFQLPRAVVQRIPTALVPLFVMTDNDVPVAVHPDSEGWHTVVGLATGAPPAELADAEWVAFLEPPAATLLGSLDPGSTYAPERGTRVAITVRSLRAAERVDAEPDEVPLRLAGPGIRGHTELAVGGVDRAVFTSLVAINASFPAGLDVWLATPSGSVAAIARSTAIEVDPSR